MFTVDQEASLEDNVEEMTEAYADVKTGEVTTAIKDSKDAHDNPIKEGDVIGISDGAIEAVASTSRAGDAPSRSSWRPRTPIR